MALGLQIAWLFVRDYCKRQCTAAPSLLERKFYYLFTCEFCFSHYITILFLFLTRYKLLMEDWRGSVLALFATGVDLEPVHEYLCPPQAGH
jgi:hypothetical protein